MLGPNSTLEEAMLTARSDFGDSIYLLCDAPKDQWKVEHVPVPVDPFVLGWKEGSLWVIDVFDPTTLEEYVGNEFTS